MRAEAVKYGERWVFSPISCTTGALHAQPNGLAVRMLACGDFTADYAVMFDYRGALDATEAIPSGSVRALDLDRMTLMVAHDWREGY